MTTDLMIGFNGSMDQVKEVSAGLNADITTVTIIYLLAITGIFFCAIISGTLNKADPYRYFRLRKGIYDPHAEYFWLIVIIITGMFLTSVLIGLFS